MADGDYERGRAREIGAIAAELKRLAAARRKEVQGASCLVLGPELRHKDGRESNALSTKHQALSTNIFVLNGWAASPHAWDLCKFRRTRIFSYIDQLDGEPETAMEGVERCILVGWSMGGSSALRLAARWPEKIAGLVLIAATPRMMEDKGTGWRGMTPHRLEALRYGLVLTRGVGLFGVPEGKPNPYLADEPANLERGLKYLLETDLREELVLSASCLVPSAELKHKDLCESNAPSTKHQALGTNSNIHIFQSEHDGIVRPENAAWLKTVFPQASVTMVPGTEHALPIFIPELIDEAVDSCIRLAAAGQDPA